MQPRFKTEVIQWLLRENRYWTPQRNFTDASRISHTSHCHIDSYAQNTSPGRQQNLHTQQRPLHGNSCLLLMLSASDG